MQQGATHCVEVSGILRRASAEEVRRLIGTCCVGVVSISYVAGQGKAVIEFSDAAQATQAKARLAQTKELAYSPPGRDYTLRAQLLASGSTAGARHVQTESPRRWRFVDVSALEKAVQEKRNEEDMLKIFDRLQASGMRDALLGEVKRRATEQQQTLKELYLAEGRPCELVFTGGRAGRQERLPSNEPTLEAHLVEFAPLFEGLPESVRRTGIDATLHRISRTVHAVAKRAVAITARVGRTIQGTVLPMLVDTDAAIDPVQELADMLGNGLLIVGPPNSGKTTALRELARLLSAGNSRVVVVVDKSMEIAGTGVVPHPCIGNARVLTVDDPAKQHRFLIEAVENQSPDIIIVDELSTKEDCQAARTIIGRGVAVVATVHGESIADVITDPERSLLTGGVASITLSAREAESRADKLRQVSRRHAKCVFGAAIELRGGNGDFADWILHEDLESAVDKYLDYKPFPASWRQRRGEVATATPLVACRQQGSTVGFAYAQLAAGDSLSIADGIDFHAVDTSSGQRIWTELGRAGSRIYERTARAAAGPPPPTFGGRAGQGAGGPSVGVAQGRQAFGTGSCFSTFNAAGSAPPRVPSPAFEFGRAAANGATGGG
jgi:stage III sporulation protein SpoIIIAA